MKPEEDPKTMAQPVSPSELSKAQLMYMRKVEKENYDRAMRLKKVKRGNVMTGFLLAGTVLGVYFYSMFRVKQEDFLDELDQRSEGS